MPQWDKIGKFGVFIPKQRKQERRHGTLNRCFSQKWGPRTKLSVGDQLLMTLQYWREYRTMAHIAHDFGIVKSTVSDTITLVEKVLTQDERFHLCGKKALQSA